MIRLKAIASIAGPCAVLAAMWVSLSLVAHAQPSAEPAAAVPPEPSLVLLLDPRGRAPQAGLLLALRIQLGAAARVQAREVPAGLDRAASAEAARAGLAAEGARAAVWPEAPAPDSGAGFTVCTLRLGPDGQPAPLEVREVHVPEGPDLDRTIALKVSEILDQNAAPPEPAAGVTPAPPPARPEPQLKRWRLGLVGQLGAAAAPLGGTGFGSWGPAIALGAGLANGRVRYEALAEATWLLPVQRTAGTAVVEVQEIVPGLRLCGAAPVGPLWLGAYTAFALSVVHGEAANERAQGKETEVAPSWLLGAAAELPLAPWFGVGVDVGVQVRLRRQRFDVENDEVADSGRVRPIARLALAFRPGS